MNARTETPLWDGASKAGWLTSTGIQLAWNEVCDPYQAGAPQNSAADACLPTKDIDKIPEPAKAQEPVIDSASRWIGNQHLQGGDDTPIAEILDQTVWDIEDTAPDVDADASDTLGQQAGDAKVGEDNVSDEDEAERLRGAGLTLIAQIAQLAERPAQAQVATGLLEEIAQKLNSVVRPAHPEDGADTDSLKQAFDQLLDQAVALPNKIAAKRLLEEHADRTMERIAEVEAQHADQVVSLPRPGRDYPPFPGRTDAYIWLRESPWAKFLKHFSPGLDEDLVTQAELADIDPVFMKALRGQSRRIKEKHGLSIVDFIPSSRWNNTIDNPDPKEMRATERVAVRLRNRARIKSHVGTERDTNLHP